MDRPVIDLVKMLVFSSVVSQTMAPLFARSTSCATPRSRTRPRRHEHAHADGQERAHERAKPGQVRENLAAADIVEAGEELGTQPRRDYFSYARERKRTLRHPRSVYAQQGRN